MKLQIPHMCVENVNIVTCGVCRGAVPGEVVGQLQLRQLNARVHVQGHRVVPLEDKIIRGV